MSDLAHPPQPKPTQAEADEFMADALGFGDENGGGAPAWVPANAKIYVDFLGGTPQGRAWVDGTGAVAITTLLPNFNAADLTPGAGWYGGGAALYAGPLLTLALASFTARIQLLWPAGVTPHRIDDVFGVWEPTESYKLQVVLDFPLMRVRFEGYNVMTLTLNSAPLNTTDNSLNAAAFTLTTIAAGGRAEFAVNGSEVTSGTYDTDDRPTESPFTAARTAKGNLALQSITFYAPLPTTAGLSALSAIS